MLKLHPDFKTLINDVTLGIIEKILHLTAVKDRLIAVRNCFADDPNPPVLVGGICRARLDHHSGQCLHFRITLDG
jgi:hypothetical protein